jgi:hypothetical protein
MAVLEMPYEVRLFPSLSGTRCATWGSAYHAHELSNCGVYDYTNKLCELVWLYHIPIPCNVNYSLMDLYL